MKINGISRRTIWLSEDGWSVDIIDQTQLPHRFEIKNLKTVDDAAIAIRDMQVRGAPLIGATAAYGLALAVNQDPGDQAIETAAAHLMQQRPTAVNLRWALDEMKQQILPLSEDERKEAAYQKAAQICDDDVETNRKIGVQGLGQINKIAASKGDDAPINILTHCNAGWLATVDWGTATSPIYQAHQAGIPIHVWVDETRPRNQGASLTAFELAEEGIPHTLIVDNAGGHLMQQGQVDLCLVGTDRTAANGDVANKIGTYLKALAAMDNDIPFYVALPSSTIDWTIASGSEIPIEERGGDEVLRISGKSGDEIVTIDLTTPGSPAANPAFDITPARLVTGLITERGIVDASKRGLEALFPDQFEMAG